MFKYSSVSLSRLNTCHEDLKLLCHEIIKYYDVTIVTGYRGREEQDHAYAIGNSKVKFPNSKHNIYPSHAVDIVSYEKTGIDWGEKQAIYLAGWVMGIAARLYSEGKMKHKIRCGLDWNMDNDIDDTIRLKQLWDPGHFELITNEKNIL